MISFDEKELSDEKLMKKYISSKCVKNKIERLTTKLRKIHLDKDKIEEIIQAILPEVIPSGLKGVTRGLEFNSIIKKIILESKFGKYASFEEKSEYCDEKVDWMILFDNKILLGMNQIDLWNGGAQLNRGFKYINKEFPPNVKMFCVVASIPEVTSSKSKLNTLLKISQTKKNLLSPNNLISGITLFFEHSF